MKIPRNQAGAAVRPFIVMCVLAPSMGAFVYVLSGSDVWALIFGQLVMLAFSIDCIARMIEYQYFYRNKGYFSRIRVVNRLRKTFCGRGVAIALHGDYARQTYRDLGYRMYDVIPDEAPYCFFSATWWRQAAGLERKL